MCGMMDQFLVNNGDNPTPLSLEDRVESRPLHGRGVRGYPHLSGLYKKVVRVKCLLSAG